MKVVMNSVAVVSLFVLTALAFEFHELSHHFFGWVACRHLGSVTFTRFEVAEGCGVWPSRIVELFGPLVSMVLAYAGAVWALKRHSLFGFGLTFASYFHLRFMPALMGGGSDEVDLVRHTGWLHGSRYAVAAILLALGLPPLVMTARALQGRWRWAVFAVAYLLPLPVLALSDKFDQLFTGPHPILPALAAASLLNVPLIVLIVNLALTIAFVLMARSLQRRGLIVRLGDVEQAAAGPETP